MADKTMDFIALEHDIFVRQNDHDQYDNAYIILANETLILINPAIISRQDDWLVSINKLNKPYHHIIAFVDALDYDQTRLLKTLIDLTESLTIYTTHDIHKHLKRYGIKKCNIIHEHKTNITLYPNREFLVLFTPYLPLRDSFILYDITSQTLFSKALFSQINKDELNKSLNEFAQMNFPSSDFVMPVIKELDELKLSSLYPNNGKPLKGSIIPFALNLYRKHYFFNNNYKVRISKKGRRMFDYVELCQQMIIRLSEMYSDLAILEVFEGSFITLDRTNLMIKDTKERGHTLWHRFFEQLYSEKGSTWIGILEPIVNKLSRDYGIRKPTIYKTISAVKEKEITRLENEKDTLNKQIYQLTIQMDSVKDKMLRCPITGLYNESFFIGLLHENLTQQSQDGLFKGMIFLAIHQLSQINIRFSNDIGDETLRNLVYLLEREKQDHQLLFKLNSQGVVLYDDQASCDQLQQYALDLRNTVSESDLFIEPITISIGLTSSKENDDSASIDQLIKVMMHRGETRLRMALKKGPGTIVDSSTDNVELYEGKILIVDDDETNQNLMKRLFIREHFDVLIAEDALQALEIVQSTKITMIISEINLSKLDGFALKQTLNESRELANIPFIMVSHNKNTETIRRALSLNVSLILEKPFYPDELIAIVRKISQGQLS